MPLYFQRPENALKRANEFIDVGKKQRALDALYDVIKSRKHRTWQKIHEPIMIKYLELCVELKKSHIAKEGLFQYRNICQQVSIKSLEDVVRGYLQLAEEKTEAARSESLQVVVDIDDLDNVETPESLLLSAVSSEDTQDRTDRVVLTPWVKFLWESYRQCLELLRNNSRVERLYHDIAQQAFRFCLKYNRKTEFRKLCDNLRAHLGHIHKHQNQQTAVNLNNPESQAMHLKTRLVQLDSAIRMELWQEAYKAIEDIHGLMTLSKKPPKAQLMANYYEKLALVFWKAGNYLFHASALFRLFYLSREQKKNITAEEIQRLASLVVLATLAVPMPPNRPEIDRLVETDENVIDKNHRLLATLLGLPNPPSRAFLIKDLVRFGVIQSAPSQLQDLYRWLESDFHPLKLCSRVSQCFDFINKWEECPELKQYIHALQDITIMRLLKEVSQVYQTIEFSRLIELAPFATNFYLENMVVEASRRNDLQVRIDHRRACLHFGSELRVSQREEVVEGPHLQSMPSEQIRNQLVTLHSVLNKAVVLIEPEKVKTSRKELHDQIIAAYKMTAKKEHKRMLERQQIIEDRKEMLENLNYQKEEEERKLMEEKQQKLREAEKERIARESEERAKQRIIREANELRKKVVMEKIEQLKKTEIGARIFEGMEEEELEKLDPDDILSRQVEELDRERKELKNKLLKQEKKIDHFERAKRLEEIPTLQKVYEEFKVEDEQFWDQQEKERVRALKEERVLSLQHRDRLVRMIEDKDRFLERLTAARSSVFKVKIQEFEKTLEEERKKRLLERKIKRKQENRMKWLKEKQDEEQRKLDEQKKREYEERLAKLEEIEAKKRAREKELEEKLKKDLEEKTAALEKEEKERNKKIADSSPKVEEPAWRKKEDQDVPSEISRPSGGWRERELAKKESWRPKEQDKDNRLQDEERDWRRRDDDTTKRTDDSISRDRGPSDDWRKKESGRGMRDERDESSWRRDDEFGSGARRPPPLSHAEHDSDWRKRQDKDREFGERDWRGADKDKYSDRTRDRFGGDRERYNDRNRDRERFGDKERFGDRDKERFIDRDKDRFGDRDKDRFGDRDKDRFGDRDKDRFGDRDKERFGDRDRDRYGDRDKDRSDRGERDRFGDREKQDREKPFFEGDRFAERDRADRFGGDRERYPDRGSEKRYQDRERRYPDKESFGGRDKFGDRSMGRPRDREFDRERRDDRGRAPDDSDWRSSSRKGAETERTPWRSNRKDRDDKDDVNEGRREKPRLREETDEEGWTRVKR